MGPINSRVVRRSNALFADYDQPYGREFAYEEAMEVRGRGVAYAVAWGSGVFEGLMRFGIGRRLIGWVAPKPGQGPSEAVMDGGFFRVQLVGTADDGREVLVTMSSDGDPGNRVTVKILCESALALAVDADALPGGEDRGGVLTPATGLGEVLQRRLQAVGFTFEYQTL
jgi:short subunit dehydrogenase-like uncharacterized protein